MIDAVAALVGDVADIRVERPNAIVRFARSAMIGRQAGADLVVDDHVTGLRTFVVALPHERDLAVDVIAAVITTACAVRRRFRSALTGMRRIAFAHTGSDMVSGHVGGNAHLNISTIHINASYVTADHPPVDVAAIVAHEMWHLIELGWEVRDYTATIAFRRELGTYFGVETIEHAVRGDVRAREQLATEVSDYATTTSKEATAEMFAAWWTRDEVSGAVKHFARVVERYFPE